MPEDGFSRDSPFSGLYNLLSSTTTTTGAALD